MQSNNNNEKEGFSLFQLIVDRNSEEEKATLRREKAETRAAFNDFKGDVKGEINRLGYEIKTLIKYFQTNETVSVNMLRTCIVMIHKMNGEIIALKQAVHELHKKENEVAAKEEEDQEDFYAILHDLNISNSSGENEV